jgi:hypothetical protein
METLLILRETSGHEGTFGAATFRDTSWHSLELPWKMNRPNFSCIPAGVYVGKLVPSPRFGRMVYLLQDVPGRSDVEQHGANWAGDTTLGWYSDLEGCITMGLDVTEMQPSKPGFAPQLAVARSWAAVQEFQDMTGGADVLFDIRWKGDNPEVV